jgi:hypothetical protein
MKRRELLQRIAALPPDADVGVQIGDEHLDISDVVVWGGGTFGALQCDRGIFATCSWRGSCPWKFFSGSRAGDPTRLG